MFTIDNMYTFPKIITLILFLVTSQVALAQRATTSSPYSRFGIGEMRGDLLPQNRGMGGISTGVRYIGGYSNINVANPASYSALQLTTIDAGIFGNITELSNSQLSENAYNFALSHVNFGIPLNRAGGLSFGILPFSDVGYSYAIPGVLDTLNIRNVYAGAGGTTKAYLGYGIQLNKNFSVGVNVGYIFGTVSDIRTLEFPNQVGSLNTRIDDSWYINGLSYDYGLQYFKPLPNNLSLTIGYSGNAGTPLNVQSSRTVTRTPTSAADDTENLPLDSISFVEGMREKITMPMKHSIGFSLAKTNKWLLGADFNYGKWSDFRNGDENPGLTDSYGIAIGGQIIPDITSVRYYNVMDYRLGFKYNKSFINLSNQDITQTAITLGLGFPLPSLFGASFYKINFAAELGQMGTLDNGLVRERYINFNLGFTLNDTWFRRRHYD